jgi:hypothetical protein
MTPHLLILGLLLGLAPAFIASGKGRSFVLWWVYGVVLGPIALVHSLMIRGEDESSPRAEQQRRVRSESPWPTLMNAAALVLIIAAAFLGYHIVVAPNSDPIQRNIAVSSESSAPEPNDIVRGDRHESNKDTAAPQLPVAAHQNIQSLEQARRLKQATEEEFKVTSIPNQAAARRSEGHAERIEQSEPSKSPAAARDATAGPHKATDLPAKKATAVSNPIARQSKPSDNGPPSSTVTAVGEIVESVQLALAKRGYDPGPASGRADRRTEHAIRAFQIDRGLDQTGSIDYPVLKALDIVGPRIFPFQAPRGISAGQ